MQKVIMFAWMIALIFFLRFLFKKGAKNIGLKPLQLFHLNTESIQAAIEEGTKDGKIGGVTAPIPVPEDAYAKQ